MFLNRRIRRFVGVKLLSSFQVLSGLPSVLRVGISIPLNEVLHFTSLEPSVKDPFHYPFCMAVDHYPRRLKRFLPGSLSIRLE